MSLWYTGVVGKVNWFGFDVCTVIVTVPLVDPDNPASVLAEIARVQVPFVSPLTVTRYVTLLPGLFVPVTEIWLAATAVLFEVTVTEDALRSPSAEVTLTFAEVFATTLIVPNVGTEESTKTWYDGETVVFPALSVTLN